MINGTLCSYYFKKWRSTVCTHMGRYPKTIYSIEIIKYYKLRCCPPKAYQKHAGTPPGKGKCVRKGRLRYSWSIFAIFRKHSHKLELRGRFSPKFSRKPSRETGGWKKLLAPYLEKARREKKSNNELRNPHSTFKWQNQSVSMSDDAREFCSCLLKTSFLKCWDLILQNR